MATAVATGFFAIFAPRIVGVVTSTEMGLTGPSPLLAPHILAARACPSHKQQKVILNERRKREVDMAQYKLEAGRMEANHL